MPVLSISSFQIRESLYTQSEISFQITELERYYVAKLPHVLKSQFLTSMHLSLSWKMTA